MSEPSTEQKDWRVEIRFSHMDQNKVFLYGRHVAYCGTAPGMPICWLGPDMAPLTDDEKRIIVKAVLDHHQGKVKPTVWTEKFFPEEQQQ